MGTPLKRNILIALAIYFAFVPDEAEGKWPSLRRQKRGWISPPRKLKENHDYTTLPSIARIRSDKENFTRIFYSLKGPGVDQPPLNVFGVDRNTGYVKIYTILDRETIAFYHLKGVAKYADGSLAEKDIDLTITVLDENDCIPVIKVNQVGSVNESSSAGTVVMKVIATDADEEDSLNSRIKYSIEEQSNIARMFYINSQTGEVIVQKNTLDRETKDTYTLIIKASDQEGLPSGNTGTGEITIKLLDINDNIPTLEKETYEGSVEENTINVEVMRIKAIDMDLIYSDNWLAVFEIISGNEAGYFSITTDSKTNEGIIMINKALDYEAIKALNLEIVVSNKAKYNFAGKEIPKPKPYNVKINVVNQKEGPRFQPSVKVVTLSEDRTSISINKVITNYAAIDSDTLITATNVRYAKIRDDDNWLIIDERTADIRLNKLPDRESKFLINGTYYAKIICITTDTPSKTATGTIAIQVEDFNDHCPRLTGTTHNMCLEDNVIYVTAVDEDEFPNSAPFQYTVISEGSQGKWSVEHLNDTTAILRDQANLWPGIYNLKLKITDQQGHSCAEAQVIDLTVCTCNKERTCVPRSSKTASFGSLGVLLMLLGLLLLLLLPLLLLFCLCGGTMGDFKPIPFDTKQQLIPYHTEGQGEDKEVPLLQTPDVGAVHVIDAGGSGNGFFGGLSEMGGATSGGVLGAQMISNFATENAHLCNRYDHSSSDIKVDYSGAGMMTGQEHNFSQYNGGVFDGMALSDEFLGDYYSSKSCHAAQHSQQKDGLLVYNNEGHGSLAGSVGCCSLLENENDLEFLNDLGPKFKTLAEICQGSRTETTFVDAEIGEGPPVLSTDNNPFYRHVHTQKETVKDTGYLNTSNISSGLSTTIHKGQVTNRGQDSATVSKVQVQENLVIPSQTLLIQQPAMYYAATPMYVVEPKPQVVVVAGGTQQAVGQVGQVGLSQGLLQVGGIQGAQGVLLVDGQTRLGGGTAQGLSQGTLSRSTQVLVVEDGSSHGGQVTQIAKGLVQMGEGAEEQVLEVRGQSMQDKSISLGCHGTTVLTDNATLTTTPKLQGNQKVVVQHKKVSVTQRNIDSTSRA